MTTLQGRPGTALLVIDMQKGVLGDAYRGQAVIATVADLVSEARAHGTPVIWVQHSGDTELQRGSDAWQIVPELQPMGGEVLVHKRFGDAFEATDLEEALARAEVGHLVVAGAQTDACVRSTLHGAFTRGYDVTLVSDAHTTEDLSQWGAPAPELVISHTNLYWSFQAAPGRAAAVVPAADVRFVS